MDSGHHLQSALSSLHAAQGMMTHASGAEGSQQHQQNKHHTQHRPSRLDLAGSYLSERGPSAYFGEFSSTPQQYHDARQPDSRPDTRDGYHGEQNGSDGEFDYLDQEGAEVVDISNGRAQFSRPAGMPMGGMNGQSSGNTSASPSTARMPTHQHEPGRSLEETVAQFWAEQMYQVEHEPIYLKHGGGPENNAGPGGALPLARIKKVMKSDPDVKMISAEAPVLLAKACEIFITELTARAWQVAEQHKRRTLQKSDVAGAIVGADMFDFLLDIVPREEAVSKSELGLKRRNEKNAIKREEKRRKQLGEEPDERVQEEVADGEVHADVG